LGALVAVSLKLSGVDKIVSFLFVSRLIEHGVHYGEAKYGASIAIISISICEITMSTRNGKDVGRPTK
jgi:hypothetical protein